MSGAAQEELQAKAVPMVSKILWASSTLFQNETVHGPGDGSQGQNPPGVASCLCRWDEVVPAGGRFEHANGRPLPHDGSYRSAGSFGTGLVPVLWYCESATNFLAIHLHIRL